MTPPIRLHDLRFSQQRSWLSSQEGVSQHLTGRARPDRHVVPFLTQSREAPCRRAVAASRSPPPSPLERAPGVPGRGLLRAGLRTAAEGFLFCAWGGAARNGVWRAPPKSVGSLITPLLPGPELDMRTDTYTHRPARQTHGHRHTAKSNRRKCPTGSHPSPSRTRFHGSATFSCRVRSSTFPVTRPPGTPCLLLSVRQPRTVTLERPACGEEAPLPACPRPCENPCGVPGTCAKVRGAGSPERQRGPKPPPPRAGMGASGRSSSLRMAPGSPAHPSSARLWAGFAFTNPEEGRVTEPSFQAVVEKLLSLYCHQGHSRLPHSGFCPIESVSIR